MRRASQDSLLATEYTRPSLLLHQGRYDRSNAHNANEDSIMLTIKTDGEGNPTIVYVSCDIANKTDKQGRTSWNFPANYPVTETDNGGRYDIPVTYHDLEAADDEKTLGQLCDEYVKLGFQDRAAARDAMTGGIRLGLGDLAKDPFKVRKGRSGERAVAAFKWLLTAGKAFLPEYTTLAETDEDAANTFLLAKYAQK